ncbi:MAG: hypothetical protein SNJ70_11380, partial [Armatimonadota bacterium]
ENCILLTANIKNNKNKYLDYQYWITTDDGQKSTKNKYLDAIFNIIPLNAAILSQPKQHGKELPKDTISILQGNVILLISDIKDNDRVMKLTVIEHTNNNQKVELKVSNPFIGISNKIDKDSYVDSISFDISPNSQAEYYLFIDTQSN